MGRLDWTVSEK
uniref:Uncharacterized protein n=1 Tax=Arundo donax TaxID=35708 RepID=A0A0A9FH74_ARUDO